MKITLSSVRHIPIIVQWDCEYYPWQLHHLIAKSWKFRVRLHQAKTLGLEFSASRAAVIREEWDMWNRCYKPHQTSAPDLLVLDAGSGEGETFFFYYLLGLRRFRLVETDASAFTILKRNTGRVSGVHRELLNRPFRAEDLREIDFAKIDVEGGEIELLNVTKESLPREIVVETHDRKTREQLQVHLPGLTFQHQLSKDPEVILWRWLRNESNETRP